MKYQLSFNIDINFVLSDHEFTFLTKALEDHSDTNHVITVGNFWYGNMGRRKWSKENNEADCFLTVTTRQMGLLIKSLEPYITYNFPDTSIQEFGTNLYSDLQIILKEAMKVSEKIHSEAEIITI